MYRIEELRNAKGLSQRQLADMSGVPQSSISRWEKDGSGMPLDKACLIANALHCTLADLAGVEMPSVVLTVDEEELLNGYRSMDKEGRSILMQLARYVVALRGGEDNK